MEGLSRNVIVGMDLMELYEITVDPREVRIAFERLPPTVELL